MEAVADESLTAGYPLTTPVRVHLGLTDGRRWSRAPTDFEGAATRPLSRDRVVQKFHWLTEPYADDRLRADIISAVAEVLAGAPAVEGNAEIGIEEYTAEILASGFPGLRGMEGRALRTQLDGYLTRIVDRDFPDLGHPLRNPMALPRWMTAHAAASSTTASLETIRDASTAGQGEKPAKTAIAPTGTCLSACGSSAPSSPGSLAKAGSKG